MERVLIIEYDAPLMRIMSAVLARSGVGHSITDDLSEATRIIGERHPDVIVFNTDMPPSMKELTIRVLRAIAPGVRILDVHAHPRGEQADVPGADASLHKPFRADELVDAVRGLLDGAGATPS